MLSDERGVLVLDAAGRVERELPLPSGQHEGLCVDGAGRLWVADDRRQVLWRFDGALAALAPRAGAGDGSAITAP